MAELLREPSVTSAITVTTTDTPTPHSIRVVPSDVDATANTEASPSASISHTRSPSNAPSPRHARGCFGRLCSLCASLRRSIREELDSLGLDGSTVIIFVSVIVLCCVCPFVVMLAIGRPTLPFSSGFLGVLLFLPAVPIVLSYALLHVTPRIREFDITMTALQHPCHLLRLFVCSYVSQSRILRLALCHRQGGGALFSLVFFCTLKCLVHVNNSTVILPSGQEMHLISLLRRARRSDHNEEQVAPSSLCPTCALSRATLAAINRDEDQRARINVLVVIPQGDVNHE